MVVNFFCCGVEVSPVEKVKKASLSSELAYKPAKQVREASEGCKLLDGIKKRKVKLTTASILSLTHPFEITFKTSVCPFHFENLQPITGEPIH